MTFIKKIIIFACLFFNNIMPSYRNLIMSDAERKAQIEQSNFILLKFEPEIPFGKIESLVTSVICNQYPIIYNKNEYPISYPNKKFETLFELKKEFMKQQRELIKQYEKERVTEELYIKELCEKKKYQTEIDRCEIEIEKINTELIKRQIDRCETEIQRINNELIKRQIYELRRTCYKTLGCLVPVAFLIKYFGF